jgi:predicted AAA+ superfamily ATPase
MHYVHGKQERDIISYLNSSALLKNVLMVEGARQAGKTTLIEHCLAQVSIKSIILNLDRQKTLRQRNDSCRDFSEFEFLLQEECRFDSSEPSILFIDESQESEQLGGFVRYMKEEWRSTWTILSGSTLNRLFRKHHRFPVGRISRVRVSPFSFSEFCLAHTKEYLLPLLTLDSNQGTTRHEVLLNFYDLFFQTGGLPGVINAHLQGDDWIGL